MSDTYRYHQTLSEVEDAHRILNFVHAERHRGVAQRKLQSELKTLERATETELSRLEAVGRRELQRLGSRELWVQARTSFQRAAEVNRRARLYEVPSCCDEHAVHLVHVARAARGLARLEGVDADVATIVRQWRALESAPPEKVCDLLWELNDTWR